MGFSMQLKQSVISFLDEKKETLRSYGVSRLGLFGSTVRNQDKADSAVDLMVEFQSGKKSYDNFIELCFFLEDNLGRKIDLLTPEGISPLIKKKIDMEIEYVQISP